MSSLVLGVLIGLSEVDPLPRQAQVDEKSQDRDAEADQKDLMDRLEREENLKCFVCRTREALRYH